MTLTKETVRNEYEFILRLFARVIKSYDIIASRGTPGMNECIKKHSLSLLCYYTIVSQFTITAGYVSGTSHLSLESQKKWRSVTF